MKDSELATAQQRLTDARKAAAAAPAAPVPAAQAAQTTQPAETAQSNPMPWLWGGVGLIVMALLAWLFMRRSPAASPKPASRRGFNSEALAASMVVPVQDDTPREEDLRVAEEEPAAVATVVDLAEVPSTPVPRHETPNWHSGWIKTAATPSSSPPVQPPPPRFVPPQPEPERVREPEPASAARVLPQQPDLPSPPPASAEQRMKLARAFLDIGDDHSAKELLRELLDGPDPAMRTEAARMLRELG